ncbi:MAG: Crp/Fnr family transcriptional regulator [Burkholderiaceae bacterium]|nr:Crp/Fnr family transcriptional regulator [Burkholderiaceae bacterium]
MATRRRASAAGGARRHSPVAPVRVEPHRCTALEKRRLLGATPFFSALGDGQLDEVAERFDQRNFTVGETIHRAGDPAERLSIVVAGQVKIARPTPDGQDVLLALLGPQEHFGSLLELGDAVYRDDAVAHTDCCVLSTGAESFHALVVRFPSVANAALALVAARLREAQATIEQLSTYPVPRRVAATLLALADRLGTIRPCVDSDDHRGVGNSGDGHDDEILIDATLSRQDLADMTGATVETVSRVLSDFRRRGWIDSGRQWVSVRDRASLKKVAHG